MGEWYGEVRGTEKSLGQQRRDACPWELRRTGRRMGTDSSVKTQRGSFEGRHVVEMEVGAKKKKIE